MRKVEHRLRLDLLRGGNQGYIRVKRGENGSRRLAIALYMHSVPYMADAGTTAVFRAIKPDNTKLFNSATITDNVVTVGLTTQTVAALGTVRCELSIYGTNNELLYSPQFDIIVEDYLYSDTAIESTDEYTDLTEAISKVNNIVSTEADRVAAENQRVANENARVAAENQRVANENARVSAETERASAETARASAESSRAFSENTRNQAEEQRVSSETQRDTAETARSTAESDRRSAEAARVQEFNTIKADAQDAATAEATRAANEAARAVFEAYDSTKTYTKYNKVTYKGSTYMNEVPCTNKLPTDTTYWMLIAAKGDAGHGLDIQGTYGSLTLLEANVTAAEQGDIYQVGTAAPYTLYMWDTTVGAGRWVSLGKLQGPQGPNEISTDTATALNGLLKGNGSTIQAAERGVDYVHPDDIMQSDWNQNDSTQPDYVKNRPFYTDDHAETVLVEESTVSFANAPGGYTGQLESTFEATVGETYKVYWDGAAYECACVYFNNMPVIGNLSIVGAGSDTGEPFVMVVKNRPVPVIDIGTADTSASHTISISSYAESVVKIDQKYLPVASKTEPGIISITPLSNAILQQVKNEYFRVSDTQVSGYGSAATIEEYANKNNSYGIYSSGKFRGAVLSCYDNTVNEYITSVLSGGAKIECWKFSRGSTTMERLWGIFEDGVVISSSTADSTKKFKITVDDSGEPTITDESDSTNTWKPTNYFSPATHNHDGVYQPAGTYATPDDVSEAVSGHNSADNAHSALFNNKQTAPSLASSLPASGTALTANTIYAVADAVGTYAFTPPATGWAHGKFTTGSSASVSFAGTFLGAAPSIEASKTYEFDVYDGIWAVQEVVTQ